ncbi:MAG: hypothetical protein NDI90_07775 [Nitrospira sp. BO4]|jgi:hypothetical protein|nr:hypothetical protein [Nitrospira sp. BO4]
MPSTSDQTPTEPPLWSIGIAALVILLAPLVLYSLAPTSPLRDGDTVFSDGQQQARISKPSPTRPELTDDTCLLDPNSPLIVIQPPTDQAEDSIIAQVQGNPANEWPFCPVHFEVILKTHQVFQKPAVFGTVREILVEFFSR